MKWHQKSETEETKWKSHQNKITVPVVAGGCCGA
jgi:hypothetical protein